MNPDGKPIDILFLTRHDWANTGYDFWRMALMRGYNAIMFKGAPHRFEYGTEAPLHPSLTGIPISLYPVIVMAPYLETLLASTYCVHFLASTYVQTNWDYSNNKVVVQHGGTTYRNYPERANAIFNKIAHKTVVQCPDLLELGANNEHLIYYPIDYAKITRTMGSTWLPSFLPNQVIRIGHFPSDPAVKGTHRILRVIKKLENDPLFRGRFQYSGIQNAEGYSHHVRWPEQLQRFNSCDVIIETCNPTIGGKVFGEWGNTALEAAALGKVVVTNHLHDDRYQRSYGEPCPLVVANNEKDLEQELKTLINMQPSHMIDIMKRQHRWAVELHGLEATAKRLDYLIYKDLF
jgi:hypothetical protein